MDPIFNDLSRFEAIQPSGGIDPYSRFDKIKQEAESLGGTAKSANAPGAKGAASFRNDQQLREVSVEFESLFVKQMLDAMRQTVDTKNDILQGGLGENIFQDMLYTEYSRLMAKSGDFGIADMLYRQFTQSPAPLNG